jgi:gamma-tubulin complex component 2
MPPPPVASSSRQREERNDRHGKFPARVLEPPIEQIAALDVRDDAEVEGLDEEEGLGMKLDGVPLEVQEAWICEDLIFVLQVRDSPFTKHSVSRR